MNKYKGKYGRKLLLSEPLNVLLKFRMWILSTFRKDSFISDRNDINKPGYELTFSDDFDVLDRNVWRTDCWWGMRYFTDSITKKGIAPKMYFDENAFEVNDSIIKIKTEKNPIEIHHIEYDGTDYGKYTIPYRTGNLDSSISFMQNKGYFELRCKIPNSVNMWPAFWLASKDSWPPEIDIFEVCTDDKFIRSTTTIHWGTNATHSMSGMGFRTPKLNNDFHIWGCSWEEDYIKIYFDGLLVRQSPTPPDFTYDMQIIINSGIHNMEDDITSPNYMEVDYVRAYKKI